MRQVTISRSVISLFLSMWSVAAWSQAVPAAAVAPAAQVPIVNPVTNLKKTVAFLKMLCTDEVTTFTSEGTGFFVAVPSSDKKIAVGYLVTNRHVAFPNKNGKDLRVLKSTVRLNRIDGQSEEVLLNSDVHWTLSDDPSVDLAILPLFPPPAVYDVKFVDFSMLIDGKRMSELGLAEAQPILFAGFFKQYPGVAHLEPIVRQGIIAMLPREGIRNERGQFPHLYLADTHAFHGNSGSPVFTDLGGFRNGSIMAGVQYVMIGVINGFFSEEAPLRAVESSTLETVAESNSGIATIVPAENLLLIMNLPSVVKEREATFKLAGH